MKPGPTRRGAAAWQALARSAILALAVTLLGTPVQADEARVSIDNFTFTPALLHVPPGTTVTWMNGDDIPHTVKAVDKSFRSKPLDTGDHFAFTFLTAGDYDYFCSLHPHMTGKIIVRAR